MTTDTGAESVTSVCIEVHAHLTEPQFRRVGQLLDENLGRHKPGSDYYVFSPYSADEAQAISAYLKLIPVSHTCETAVRWDPPPL